MLEDHANGAIGYHGRVSGVFWVMTTWQETAVAQVDWRRGF
jgi:hypothetical protein